VVQLNANLKALGYDPYGAIPVSDAHFGDATAAAVRRFQQAEKLPQTGTVELGRVVFAPSARRITAMHVSLGTTVAGSGNGNGNNGNGNNGNGNGNNGKGSPSKSSPHSPSTPSDSSAPDTLVASTTSTRPLVHIQVAAAQQQIARVGERVTVTLPDGRLVNGRISSVGTVASAASGGGSATVAVTVILDRRVAHLDQAPVSVQITRSRRRNVLAVPATALVATAGGGYAVEAFENGRRVEVPVTPGMFAGGYVQIDGPGVHEGLTVTQSQ
jgi:peptidoglycan hydrolase-like protein with peptidoglycan-binding domain